MVVAPNDDFKGMFEVEVLAITNKSLIKID